MDLRVDTDALRRAAGALSEIADGVAPGGNAASLLHGLGDVCGDRRVRAEVDNFDHQWRYGLSLIGTDAAGLAYLLNRCAEVIDEAEAHLGVAAGGRFGFGRPAAGASALGPPSPATPLANSKPGPSVSTQTGSPLTQLAFASHPRDLIPGDPAGVEDLAARLRSFAVNLALGAGSVRQLTTGGWVGTAADAFAAEAQRLPVQLDDAARSIDEASRALREYGHELIDAQSLARRAMDQWQQVEAALRDNQSQLGPMGWGVDPVVATANLTGPAAQARDEALRLLAAAQDRAESAGEEVRARLRQAADAAPDKPGFWSTVGNIAGNVATAVGDAALDTGADVLNMFASAGNAMLHHPDDVALTVLGAALMAAGAAGTAGGAALAPVGGVGVPIAAASAATAAAGLGLAAMGAGNIAHNAAGDDRVTPVSGSGAGPSAAGPAGPQPLPRPDVSDPKLANLVKNLYKGVDNPRAGLGTTADAIRAESATGQATAGKFHAQKGEETLRGLDKWLRRNPDAEFHDVVVATSLRDELLAALGRGPK